MAGLLQTGILQMRRGVFLKEMIKMYGAPWIISFSILLAASVCLVFFQDLRWAVVAFMIVCLAAPMMLIFFYVYHGLRPVTVINTLPHTLCFDDDCIEATIFSECKNRETGDTEYKELSRRRLPYSGLARYKTGLTSILLPFRDAEKGFIWLPVNAFNDKKGFDMAMDRIIKAIRKNYKNIDNEDSQRK